MPTTSENHKPQMVPDDASNLRIRFLDDGIHDQPVLYRDALNLINPADLTRMTTEEPPEHLQAAAAKILEFFEERDDREVTYDDATDESLTKSSTYLELLAAVKRSHPRIIKRGTQQSQVDTPEAQAARDRLRHLTLGHYIGRVAAWNIAHTSDGDHIRSAS